MNKMVISLCILYDSYFLLKEAVFFIAEFLLYESVEVEFKFKFKFKFKTLQ